MTSNENLESLRRAINRLHGCEASHIRTDPVKETFQGKTLWQGTVEVFDLQDHRTANQCYAWSFKEDSGETRVVAVLHAPPVYSSVKAVRAFINNDAETRKGNV